MGKASTLITVPMSVFTSAKIAATRSRVSTSCSVSPGSKGMTLTPSTGMRVTIQMANALTTTRSRKPIVAPVSHARTSVRQCASRRLGP